MFRVNINPTDQATTLLNPTPNPAVNPTGYNTQLPGHYLVQAATNGTNLGATLRSSSTAAGSMPSTDRA